MMSKRINIWVIMGAMLLLMQSCSEDNSADINTDEEVQFAQGIAGDDLEADRRNDRIDNVRSLENTLAVEWTDLFLEIERYAEGMRPNATARALAYIHLAAYETAVPGMNGFESNSGKIPGFRMEGRVNARDINWEIALNKCYATVVDHFVLNIDNDQRDKIANLESSLSSDLVNDLPNRIVRDSRNWGLFVANQVILYSQTDKKGEEQILEPQPLSYEPPTGDGYWTYSAEQERALFPYWGSVRTFVVPTNRTTTVSPLRYSERENSPYFKQMAEVYNVNNTAKAQDNEQLWIAEFWSDDVTGITFSPPSRQFSIANQLIEQYDYNLEEALHLNLKLGFSLNDAAVSTWKYKYQHMVMRPNVFIHEFIDPAYQTNLYRLVPWPNPTFPGYPSGHSCFASAAGGVFKAFFGNKTNFTDKSHEGRSEFRGAARTFTSFDDMAEENAFSRIPLGVHIKMDCTEGIRLGYEISDGINRYQLKRRR